MHRLALLIAQICDIMRVWENFSFPFSNSHNANDKPTSEFAWGFRPVNNREQPCPFLQPGSVAAPSSESSCSLKDDNSVTGLNRLARLAYLRGEVANGLFSLTSNGLTAHSLSDGGGGRLRNEADRIGCDLERCMSQCRK